MKNFLFIFCIVILQVQKCLPLPARTMEPGTMTVDCGYSASEAKITYTGEPYAVVAYDDQDEAYFFDEDISTASFTKVIPFQKNETNLAFMKSTDILEEYTVKALSRNTYKEFETAGDVDYIVTCTFSPMVHDITTHVEIEEIESSPILNEAYAGPENESEISSVIDLMLTDVNGDQLTGSVPFGKLVKLKTVMTPQGDEVGFRVSSCEASSEDSTVTASFLSFGCGTGSLFKTDQGFTITGLVGYSPVFKMFQLKRRQSVVFQCTYSICLENCDGNTCKGTV